MELPSEFDSGHLACYTPPGAIRPSRFVWLAGPGLYRGSLSLASGSESNSELEALTERSLLPLPLTSGLQEGPLAVVRCLLSPLIPQLANLACLWQDQPRSGLYWSSGCRIMSL